MSPGMINLTSPCHIYEHFSGRQFHMFCVSACCIKFQDQCQAAVSERAMWTLWELDLVHDKPAQTGSAPRHS